ncbi:MAG: BrnA antitoxin family protein, partial [Candidatus Accumulibacter sp.]|nr:BrnA antitoxin family protein [Accumulibacter sp.]
FALWRFLIAHTETTDEVRIISFRKRSNVKNRLISFESKTDWTHLRSGVVQTSAGHPEADADHMIHGVVRRGLAPQTPKTAISLRLDREVCDWF